MHGWFASKFHCACAGYARLCAAYAFNVRIRVLVDTDRQGPMLEHL